MTAPDLPASTRVCCACFSAQAHERSGQGTLAKPPAPDTRTTAAR
ncbi:hypothetical protein [Streptomyces sp. NPDC056544]